MVWVRQTLLPLEVLPRCRVHRPSLRADVLALEMIGGTVARAARCVVCCAGAYRSLYICCAVCATVWALPHASCCELMCGERKSVG